MQSSHKTELLHNACTKKYFAKCAGISKNTLLKWLKQHKDKLKTFNQNPNDKYLNPQTVQFLAQYYIVTP